MDYEKKLALAKEALDSGSYDKETIEYIFPELKESDDEQHRKWILEYLYDGLQKSDEQFKDHFKCAIAWLEKQSKQKPDTDFSNIRIWKYIVDEVLTEKEGIGQYLDSPFTEEVAKKLQKRFGNIEQRPAFEMKTPEESLGIDSDTYNKIVDECVYGEQTSADETPYPETLEKAINLYYYSYGNGKGEFEHLSLKKFRDIVHTFVSDYEQKPAWSEEDERKINYLIALLQNSTMNDDALRVMNEEVENWLKDLKNRVQPKQEWSEEDERIRIETIELLETANHPNKMHSNGKPLDFTENINWLISLKDKVFLQPQQKWGEKDKGNLLDVKCIIDEVWHNQYVRETIDHSCEELESLWHWLDNIWKRVEYPQTTWKPSDEQMKAIKWIIDGDNPENWSITIENLYQDLKKLREK